MDSRLPWQQHAYHACLDIKPVCSCLSAAGAHICAQVCTQSHLTTMHILGLLSAILAEHGMLSVMLTHTCLCRVKLAAGMTS